MSLLSAIIDTLHFKRKDGSEYIVYPATKEKAVTDENGQRLDRKLEKIQNDINNVVAGELPDGTTYVDLDNPGAEEVPDNILLDADTLQGHSADEFALKEDVLEPWNYNVAANQPINFNDQYRILVSESGSWTLQKYKDNDWHAWMIVNANGKLVYADDADINKNLNVEGTLNALAGLNVTGSLEVEGNIDIGSNNVIGTQGRINFNTSNAPVSLQVLDDDTWQSVLRVTGKEHIALPASMYFDNPFGVYFANSTNNSDLFRILSTSSNTLQLQSYTNGAWTTILSANADASLDLMRTMVARGHIFVPYGHEIRLYNDTSIRFNNLDNSFQNYEIYSSPSATDSSLVTRYKPSSGSIWNRGTALHPNGQFEVYGDLKVDGNISAPNIASTTAELLSIQQDLTEKDIESIKTQQKITTMELAMIESGVLQS